MGISFAGPNPTHQVHLTWFWVWLWLAYVVELRPKTVSLLMDCKDPDMCFGPYGHGIAPALMSEVVWLPEEAQPIVVEQYKFSLGGTWPFTLWHHEYVRPAAVATPSLCVVW